MVLQELSAVAMALVESSWLAASVLAKYFLAIHVGEAVYRREYLSIVESIVKYSRLEVTTVLMMGVVFMSTGFKPSVGGLSQLMALIYLTVLFWNY